MTGRSIFVCYRREDSAPYAGRLYDRLVKEFDRERVFFDVDIDYGDDFERTLQDALNRVSVVLVVIGPKWHDVRDRQGARRLDLPDDYVHLEIQRTLERDIHLIPVLAGGARMPEKDELPVALQRLAKRQGAPLGDASFNGDVEKLIASIKRRLPEDPPIGDRAGWGQRFVGWVRPIGYSLAAAALLALTYWWVIGSGGPPSPEAAPVVQLPDFQPYLARLNSESSETRRSARADLADFLRQHASAELNRAVVAEVAAADATYFTCLGIAVAIEKLGERSSPIVMKDRDGAIQDLKGILPKQPPDDAALTRAVNAAVKVVERARP